MTFTVVGSSVNEWNTAVPAGTAAGDLILVFGGQYSSALPGPSGYTAVGSDTTGTGSFVIHAGCWKKTAVGTEGGTNVSAGAGNGYNSVACIVLRDTATPTVDASAAAGDGTSPVTLPAVTATGSVRRIGCAVLFSNSGPAASFTTPTGWTQEGFHAGGARLCLGLYLDDTDDAAGSLGSVDVVSSLDGGNVGITVAINVAAAVTIPSGTAAGGVAWAGSASGTAPSVPASGAATGLLTWSGSATGAASHAGTASGALAWVASASGRQTFTVTATVDGNDVVLTWDDRAATYAVERDSAVVAWGIAALTYTDTPGDGEHTYRVGVIA